MHVVGKLLFGEERRRTKIIPHAFERTRVLKLIYAALIRRAGRWRGIGITELEQHRLKAISLSARRSLKDISRLSIS